jgi:hypothetical protein
MENCFFTRAASCHLLAPLLGASQLALHPWRQAADLATLSGAILA